MDDIKAALGEVRDRLVELQANAFKREADLRAGTQPGKATEVARLTTLRHRIEAAVAHLSGAIEANNRLT